jgi:cysteinyl-tRNA synthetase
MRELLEQVKREIAVIAGVLGVITSVPGEYQTRLKARKSSQLTISVAEIEALVAERSVARKARDFKRSDEIRDGLLAQGIELLDGPGGTEWKVK